MVKKGNLSDFKNGMVSPSISETDVLGYSHTTISRVYTGSSKKAKISSYLQISRLKGFDARIQVIIARLFQASRQATVNNRSLQSKHAEEHL